MEYRPVIYVYLPAGRVVHLGLLKELGVFAVSLVLPVVPAVDDVLCGVLEVSGVFVSVLPGTR